jgi:hypothetical protein
VEECAGGGCGRLGRHGRDRNFKRHESGIGEAHLLLLIKAFYCNKCFRGRAREVIHDARAVEPFWRLYSETMLLERMCRRMRTVARQPLAARAAYAQRVFNEEREIE